MTRSYNVISDIHARRELEFGPEHEIQNQIEMARREMEGRKVEPLDSREMEAVNKRIEILKKLLHRDLRAKFKIEVHFDKHRTTVVKPFCGAISVWLSGTMFNGGGDQKLYECPNPECGALIYPYQISQQNVVENGFEEFKSISYCSKCGRVWDSEKTIGERLLKLTHQNWVEAIIRVMLKLDMDADIYLKFHTEDIRYRTMMEMARDRGGEEIARVRKSRALHIYPLKNIIQDTKNGASLESRIKAFISA